MKSFLAYGTNSGLMVTWDLGAPGTGNFWGGYPTMPDPSSGTMEVDNFPLGTPWP